MTGNNDSYPGKKIKCDKRCIWKILAQNNSYFYCYLPLVPLQLLLSLILRARHCGRQYKTVVKELAGCFKNRPTPEEIKNNISQQVLSAK